MFARRLVALLFITSSACMALAGCSADTSDAGGGEDGDDNTHIGDGNAPEDEIVAERQLNGSEMADKTISLTFDDGPGQRTAELADYLADKNIKAAFFINGMKVPGRQSHIDKIVGRGHLLANHTQNHKQLTRLSSSQLISEITETDDIIKAAQPNGPWIIRAPFGAWNGNIARTVNGTAMKKYVGSVFWDEGGALTTSAAADWDCWGKGVSVSRCGELYLQEIRAKKRGIVLFHDIHNKTVDMIKEIVPKLIADGYKFQATEETPAVKRAIAAAGGGGAAPGGGATPPPAADSCSSATLGRDVGANVCVQSRSTQKWSGCEDGDWVGSSADDPKCTQKFPL
jgi:peptidoglycan/xylan/chitin deacetylase (PgdA/CDA1 family)